MAERNFALYEAAKAADEAFQARLIEVYGVKRACEKRYQTAAHHDSQLNALIATKHAADASWIAEMRRDPT
jgi:hypothetical protein